MPCLHFPTSMKLVLKLFLALICLWFEAKETYFWLLFNCPCPFTVHLALMHEVFSWEVHENAYVSYLFPMIKVSGPMKCYGSRHFATCIVRMPHTWCLNLPLSYLT